MKEKGTSSISAAIISEKVHFLVYSSFYDWHDRVAIGIVVANITATKAEPDRFHLSLIRNGMDGILSKYTLKNHDTAQSHVLASEKALYNSVSSCFPAGVYPL